MSISPYFQTLVGGDLTAEEIADDGLLPKVIELKIKALKQEDDLVADNSRFNAALTDLKIVGARANFFKAKRAQQETTLRAKIKESLDMQVAVARTDAKLRRITPNFI